MRDETDRLNRLKYIIDDMSSGRMAVCFGDVAVFRWALAEVGRLKAELAAAKAEPPRPAAIVWLKGDDWHLFQSFGDALEFGATRDHNKIIAGVHSWTWHPEKST